MNKVNYIKPNFPEDVFAGTAEYYFKYRVPYPKLLLDDLIERARIKKGDKLLDLACGPGRVSIPLASSFESVLCIDIEPDMIEMGKKVAASQGVTNISWKVGKVENLKIESNQFQLVTIGEAFHRLDQRFTATHVYQWLSPGCCLVTMGAFRGNEPWQRIVKETVHKWTKQNSKSNENKEMPVMGPEHNELVFKDAGFAEVKSYNDFVHTHVWTIESIIGYLYSTSYCSRKVLGSHVEDFENDLKEALLSFDPSGTYHETMQFGYTLARKPK